MGSTIELKDVLLLGGAGDVRVGTPIVDGASVVAEVLEHGRDKKILVFKYKNKTRYRRRFGHRQDFTRLAIRQILADGQVVETAEEPRPKRPARKKAEKPAAEAVTTAEAVEEPAPEPAPPRRRATRPKAEAQAGTADEAPAEAKTATAEEAPAQTEKPKPRRPRASKPKARAAAEPEAAPKETPEGE